MSIKKNIPLLAGIAIPVLMIIFVAASIYIPGIFIKPKFDFVYSEGTGTSYNPRYVVRQNKIVPNENYRADDDGYYPMNQGEQKIFLYDIVRNRKKELSLEEAQKFSLDSSRLSPDGFEIIPGNNGAGFFPFSMADYDHQKYFIRGRNVSRELNINISGSYYDSFNFIGWVTN